MHDDRFDRRPREGRSRVSCAVERTRTDLALEEVEQPESERRKRDEADDRERREQTRARAPGERRKPLWSCRRAAGRRHRLRRQRTPRSFWPHEYSLGARRIAEATVAGLPRWRDSPAGRLRLCGHGSAITPPGEMSF